MRLGWATRGILAACVILSLANELYVLLHAKPATDAPGAPAATPRSATICPYLAIVLGSTPWWALWTLLTAPLVQTRVFYSLILLFVVASGGSYCERCWSTPVYFRFAALVLAAPVFCECVLGAILLRSPRLALNGANGLLAGVILALRLLIPGHTIILLKNRVRIAIRWLPAASVVICVVLQVFNLTENAGAFYIGIVLSWIYLRFLHLNERGERGDASDAFSFASLLPRPLMTLCEPTLDRMYFVLARRLHLVKNFSEEEIQLANERYAARLSGKLLPVHARNARSTNQRRKMMLRAMGV